MKPKVQERKKAEELRRKGYSYNDIQSELGLAKSTLSCWLKDFPLTEEEKKYLKKRSDKNISRGRIKAAAAHRRNRLNRDNLLRIKARGEFDRWIYDSFFQVGVALYWAEGSRKSWGFQFVNSDPEMVVLMCKWIKKYLGASPNELYFRLYIHKPYAHDNCEKYWIDRLGVSQMTFRKTVYKPTPHSYRLHPGYKGCIQVMVPKGTNALRKMVFWQKMLVDHYSDM